MPRMRKPLPAAMHASGMRWCLAGGSASQAAAPARNISCKRHASMPRDRHLLVPDRVHADRVLHSLAHAGDQLALAVADGGQGVGGLLVPDRVKGDLLGLDILDLAKLGLPQRPPGTNL